MAAFCPRTKGTNPVICHDGRGASCWRGSVKFAGSGSDGSRGQRLAVARRGWTGGGRAPEMCPGSIGCGKAAIAERDRSR